MSLTEQERWDVIIRELRGGLAEAVRPCRDPACGHPEDLHRHYHSRTYCALACCACQAYRAPLPRWVQRLRNLPRRQKGNRDAH